MAYLAMTPEDAEELSRAAQEAQMPLHLRPANYGTTHTFAWMEHPTDPNLVVLEIPEHQNIVVHAEADRSRLDKCLAKLQAKAAATKGEVDEVKLKIDTAKASQIAAVEIVPVTLRAAAPKTREEAIAAGLIKAEEVKR
jgi:hypothetical protein